GIVGALLLILAAHRRAFGRLNPLLAILPVGIYAVVIGPLWIAYAVHPAQRNRYEGSLPLYGTLWSYVNGMESALTLLAFGVLLWLVVARPLHGARTGLVVGAACGLLTLARLDHAIIALGVLAVVWAVAVRQRDRRAGAAVLTALVVLGAVIAAYCAWNLAYAGTVLPVSGALKLTFPRPTLGNARQLRTL